MGSEDKYFKNGIKSGMLKTGSHNNKYINQRDKVFNSWFLKSKEAGKNS